MHRHQSQSVLAHRITFVHIAQQRHLLKVIRQQCILSLLLALFHKSGYTVHKFLKPGSWYSIPYRSLVTNEIENLIVAGRCISATQEACSSTRLTPIVMALGQAAGTAAAQSVATGEKANALNTDTLRAQLKQDGAFLEEYKG